MREVEEQAAFSVYADRNGELCGVELYHAVKATAKVPGEMAEVGVYLGGTAAISRGATIAAMSCRYFFAKERSRITMFQMSSGFVRPPSGGIWPLPFLMM
jgi:hypothetical protein